MVRSEQCHGQWMEERRWREKFECVATTYSNLELVLGSQTATTISFAMIISPLKTTMDDAEQLRISLVLAKDYPDRSYEVPSEPMAVPASLGRQGLTTLVQHLLEVEADVSFEFVVGRTLLRTTLDQESRKQGLSLEKAMEVVYFPALPALSSSGASEALPDWISGLQVANGTVIAACYDGSLQVLDAKLNTMASTLAHQGPCRCLAAQAMDDSTIRLASGSMDQSLVVYEWNGDSLYKVADCMDGHMASVSSVDLQPQGFLVSGDWDGGLCLWKSPEEEDPVPQATKRSKTGTSSTTTAQSWTPTSRFQAHSSKVSGVAWTDDLHVVTGSWDHTLKLWDLQQENCLLTLNGARVVSCLAAAPNVVATGHPDCRVRLWDVRVGDQALAVNDTTFQPSHRAWIADVRWSPSNPYQLASTSHDGTVKVWDIRSPVPLQTIRVSEEKGLCVAYGGDNTLYSGGTDCEIKRIRAKQ